MRFRRVLKVQLPYLFADTGHTDKNDVLHLWSKGTLNGFNFLESIRWRSIVGRVARAGAFGARKSVCAAYAWATSIPRPFSVSYCTFVLQE